ncbi:hypothetical protein [Chryseobacterium sp. JV558]|uniref:hypothetical protein n=1 Tax=Chryseobacterium sp. JV558 TaxID=2663236 RepID=UPI00299DE293|nr:hypothetical protein [Chryseobacterium sp. JV558]MDW9381273.1 hypothetical protein [Chryseobacterium sp. JV558]
MKKLFFFFLLSSLWPAQKTEFIELNNNLKDRKGLTKSLTFIDSRSDRNIGSIQDKKDIVQLKFANDDLKGFIENRFREDNKVFGNNDIVLMLEDLKVYEEQDSNRTFPYAKARIKLSSFIKRNDKYYFIGRYNNVIVSNPKIIAHSSKDLADTISEIFNQFIKASYYPNIAQGYFIPENEIIRYEEFLNKGYKAFNNDALNEGVYTSFQAFHNQEPDPEYSVKRNKKGNVVQLNYNGQETSLFKMYCYVENGKAYKTTPVGMDEIKKDSRGFFIYSSRTNLFAANQTGGLFVGALAGGLVGALIGAAIDSSSSTNAGAVQGVGFRSTMESNVYLDSLTGGYIFEK